MTSPVATEFCAQAIFRMEESTRMCRRALEELPEEALWLRPNESSNSVGNLLLHLCGNIRQYIHSGLGGQPDIRQRNAEFAIRQGYSKSELWSMLEQTVREACELIRQADDENLLRVRRVQGFQLSGIGIILHVVEHYSYHTGQIAFWIKSLRNVDLGFYAGYDLNAK
ncbi:MAG: DUF1572 domain-containing protein [Saprospiraceae bacterium]|nr:DUF1572 domain-containing protein [Saprospiraceae bacterium]MDW8484272.1 DinB family protein [Saprospiraceae bacterium]